MPDIPLVAWSSRPDQMPMSWFPEVLTLFERGDETVPIRPGAADKSVSLHAEDLSADQFPFNLVDSALLFPVICAARRSAFAPQRCVLDLTERDL